MIPWRPQALPAPNRETSGLHGQPLKAALDAPSTPGGPTEGGVMSKPEAGNSSRRRGLGGALTI